MAFCKEIAQPLIFTGLQQASPSWHRHCSYDGNTFLTSKEHLERRRDAPLITQRRTMIFSSNIFLFVFLPVFLAAYYATPERHRSWTILVGSYLFYGWWRIDFLFLFFGVTLVNYFLGMRISRAGERNDEITSARWLKLGVVANLATLGYFKYANFGAETVAAVMSALGSDSFLITQVILPIGISFYIFQAISYLIDVHRKDTPPTENFIQFAAFISLFPQLIAGPVLRYKDVAEQFRSRTHSAEKFSRGAERFMIGFCKKVIIADSLAPIVDAGFGATDPSTADAVLATLAYTAQLYFDFSGYADMAIGLGLMMGFRFVENFNQPYISQSITEFWRRWHISLSNWLRDYLYISLGGNRGGTLNTYRNLFLTMLLGGLWHGANWTFIVWGAWHGTILAIEKALGVNPNNESFSLSGWALTLLLVMIGWVMFRADSVSTAFGIYAAILSFEGFSLTGAVALEATSLRMTVLGLAWLIIILRGVQVKYPQVLSDSSTFVRYGLAPTFLLALLKLSADSHSPFLYFQF